jgi:hypothetical protein
VLLFKEVGLFFGWTSSWYASALEEEKGERRDGGRSTKSKAVHRSFESF